MQFSGLTAPQGLTWVTLGAAPWQMTSVSAGPQVHAPMLEQQLRRREEALLAQITAVTASQHQPVPIAAVPAASSKPQRSSASAPGTSGGVSKTQAPRMSRWRRDKCRMGNLEQQVMEKRAEEQQAAQDNYRLKMRAEALEHAVAVHELQMAMLNRNITYPTAEARNQLVSWVFSSMPAACTSDEPTSGCSPTCAAVCVHDAQATKYRDFVSEASLLMLSLTEEANTPADQPVLARIADMVRRVQPAASMAHIQQHTWIRPALDMPTPCSVVLNLVCHSAVPTGVRHAQVHRDHLRAKPRHPVLHDLHAPGHAGPGGSEAAAAIFAPSQQRALGPGGVQGAGNAGAARRDTGLKRRL